MTRIKDALAYKTRACGGPVKLGEPIILGDSSEPIVINGSLSANVTTSIAANAITANKLRVATLCAE